MPFDWLALRYRFEYLAFRAAGRLFRRLGLERASAVSGFIWRHIAPWSKRHRRALNHLGRAFPEKTTAEHAAIARAMWDNLGRTFAEAFFLEDIAAENRITYEGIEAFEAWARLEGGRVVCAAHMANWEVAIVGITRAGLCPASFYQRIKNPHVDRDVQAMRSFLYPGGITAKNPALPRHFMRIIRKGGTIGVLADLRDYTGAAVPFFGQPAPSTTFPALLAQSAGTPVLVTCMRRLPGVRFVQHYELLELASTGDRKADIVLTTMRVQEAFERFIRVWPEQWMWAHRRWG